MLNKNAFYSLTQISSVSEEKRLKENKAKPNPYVAPREFWAKLCKGNQSKSKANQSKADQRKAKRTDAKQSRTEQSIAQRGKDK